MTRAAVAGAIRRTANILDSTPMSSSRDYHEPARDRSGIVGAAASGRDLTLHAAELDFSAYRRLTRITTMVGALLSRRPDVVVVNGAATRAFHERLGFRPRQWRLVHNGVDIDRFRRSTEARASVGAELGFEQDDRLVGLFARWDPMKDHATFVQAAGVVAEANPQAQFLLAGDGIHGGNQELAQLIAQVPPLQGRTRLLGLRHDMPRLNAALDVACVSSASGEFLPVCGGGDVLRGTLRGD
jgi:glycosyltransferase involved in cell wall biosynthesis